MTLREDWMRTGAVSPDKWARRLTDEVLNGPMLIQPVPYRHAHRDHQTYIPICFIREHGPTHPDIVSYQDTCHHCRIATASILVNKGHHMVKVEGTIARRLGVPDFTSMPASLVLQSACEEADDVVMLKALPAIFERASRFT